MKKNTLIVLLSIAIMMASYSCNDENPSSSIQNNNMEMEEKSTTCEIINHGNESGPLLNQSEELAKLEDVYDQFETHVRDKNLNGLNNIFLHNSIQLFITGKRPTGIQNTNLDGSGFRNYVTSTPGLELRISDTDFRIKNGVAVSWAKYEEVTSSGTSATGVDLFFYINTANGWKLATTNNTFVIPGDYTDYETEYPMSEAPGSVLVSLVSSFNQKDQSAWLENFKSQSTLIVVSSEFSETFFNGTHTTNAFINCIATDEDQYTLSITNENIEVQDQYLAMVLADYSIALGGDEVESGELVLTMIGTPQSGWKISAAAFTY